MTSADRVTSCSVVDQLLMETRIAGVSRHRGPREPAGPILLHPGDRFGGERAVVSVDREQHLIERDLVEHSHALRRRELVCHEPRQLRAAFDHRGDSASPEGSQSGPDDEAARPAGGLGHVLGSVARLLSGDEVGSGELHGGAHRIAVPDDRQPAVVRDIQPLVRVGRPGVRALDAAHLLPKGRRSSGPETERAVDVEPGTMPLAEVGDLVEGIERSSVDLPGLRADDRRPVEPREGFGEGRGDHPTLLVGADPNRGLPAEAQEAQGGEHRHVRLLPNDHVELRGALQSTCLDIPANAAELGAPSCRQAGEVRHLRTGGETDDGRFGQSQELQQPAGCHLLRDGSGR